MVAPRSSLRRGLSANLVATIIQALGQAGVAMTIGHVFGREGLGAYALAAAVLSPLMLLGNLHLRTMQATDVRGDHPFTRYLRVRLISIIVWGGFVTGIASLWSTHAASGVLMALLLVRVVESIADIFHGEWQRREWHTWIGVSLSLRTLAFAVSVIVAILLGWRLHYALIAGAVASAVMVIVHDGWRLRTMQAWAASQHAGEPVALRALLLDALPLGVAVGASMWALSVPRIALEMTAGLAALGLFAAMLQLVEVGAQVLRSMVQVLLPRMSRYVQAGDLMAYRKLVAFALAIGVALAGGGMLVAWMVGNPLLRLLFGVEFTGHADVLVLAFAAAIPLYAAAVLGTAVTAYRRFARLVTPYIFSALIATGLAVILIPSGGVTGALLALAGIGVAQCLSALYAVRYG